MPRKITKYLCEFKCGKAAMKDVAEAEKHEKGCWKNPQNKTCETCINRIYERDTDDYSTWHYRDCKIPAMSEFLEEIHDCLDIKNGIHHIRPLFHCPNHNQSEESVETKEYINNVRDKILGAKKEMEENLKLFP